MNVRHKRKPDRKVIERISIKDDGVFVAWYLEVAEGLRQERKNERVERSDELSEAYKRGGQFELDTRVFYNIMHGWHMTEQVSYRRNNKDTKWIVRINPDCDPQVRRYAEVILSHKGENILRNFYTTEDKYGDKEKMICQKAAEKLATLRAQMDDAEKNTEEEIGAQL